MADALVSFVLDQLLTVIKDEFQLEVGVRKEIKKLTITFTAIQAFLKNADHRQFHDESVKLWLEEFKDVAYDMEDVLDEWNTKLLIQSSQITGTENASITTANKKKVHSFLCSLFSCFGEVGLHHDIGSRIQNIRERVDFIANEKDKYHLIETNTNHEGPVRLDTSSLMDESDVCGRNFEKDIILNKLLGETSTGGSCSSSQKEMGFSHRPIIISIVGMGGLGKTTLAQLVFNDEQVKNHFEKIMWVCVSDTFDLPRLAEAIIKEAGSNVRNNPEWNELHNSLSRSVKGKRFLLVLDDVWSDDPIKWKSLELALKSGAQGSRILVTTRNEKVAKIMNSTYIYDLKILSDNDCWSLISRIAFVDRGKQEQETLNGIGIEIAKKCKGLPLAAKALGSLLRFKNTESDWENVLNSDIWQIEEVENNFLKPALLLSYFDLPSPLKPCFTYCSIFPKDQEMEKDVLIKLWMAQGFLSTTGKREDLEVIGEEYFNNLVSRSFFQDIKFQNGNISTCKMHDLIHDFAQFLMGNECYVTQMDDTHFHNKIRHLSLYGQYGLETSLDPSIYKAKNLRTFQVLWRSAGVRPYSFFSKFNCLRVLCLKGSGLSRLSSEIGTLIHLRYLDLSNNYQLKELPESITSLHNLQTLELAGNIWSLGSGFRKLPEEMWRLHNLRHLNIEKCHPLLYIPRGIGKLTSLRTLTNFRLSGMTQGSSTIEELKDLNYLQGKLRISGLDGVKTTKNEASEARLKYKIQLRILELLFKEIEDVGEMNSLIVVDRLNDVLEGLEPPPKLEMLLLENFMGSKFPSWIADNSILSNLKVLTLEGCKNCIEFPALGRLVSLENLYIRSMNQIKQIPVESYEKTPIAGTCDGGGTVKNGHKLFPKLKLLQLQNMDNLEELGNGVADAEDIIEIMPCLFDLEIWECPKLKLLPRKLVNLKNFINFFYSPSLSQLPYLPKLKFLSINSSKVARLPQGFLAQLNALQSLQILEFPELVCVPEEVKHLTNLQELSIYGCENLVPRCRKDEGEDWSIISHIPNITINDKKIQ